MEDKLLKIKLLKSKIAAAEILKEDLNEFGIDYEGQLNYLIKQLRSAIEQLEKEIDEYFSALKEEYGKKAAHPYL
jgi:hypothetical protein